MTDFDDFSILTDFITKGELSKEQREFLAKEPAPAQPDKEDKKASLSSDARCLGCGDLISSEPCGSGFHTELHSGKRK